MQGVWRKVWTGTGAVLAAGGVAAVLSGCSTELDGFGNKPSAMDANRLNADAPVAAHASAVPASAVETTPVPPPVREASAATAITPRTNANNVPLTPPPANPGGEAYAPTAAKEQLAGAWNFSWDDGRNTCPLTLSTTRGLSALSAQADVSCPSEIFMTKGWDMMGPDLVLQNHQGKVTARLKPAGPNRYVGVLADTNQQVALAR